MWTRILLIGAILVGGGWVASPPVQAACLVDSGTYTTGQVLRDVLCDTSGNQKVTLGGTASGGLGTATAAAPSLAEGAGAAFSFDLSGNARVTLGTTIFGEDTTNNLLMTSGGAVRVTTFSLVHAISTSSSTTILPRGPIRFMASMIGSSESKAMTLGIYGNFFNSTTGGILICTITIPAATTTHIEDTCPLTEPNFLYYWYTTSAYTSASNNDITVSAMY